MCKHARAWTCRKAKAIGQKCEKPWENLWFCSGEDRNRTFLCFSNVFPFSMETGSKAPFWSFEPVYLLSTHLQHHPKLQVVVTIPRRIPVPSGRSALDSLDQIASTSLEKTGDSPSRSRSGIPAGTKPLAGGKRSATTGGSRCEAQKGMGQRSFTDQRSWRQICEPLKIESPHFGLLLPQEGPYAPVSALSRSPAKPFPS